MTKGALLAVVVVCFTLAGCSTLGTGPIEMAKSPLDCRKDDCKVAVSVSCGLHGCKPMVSAEVVIISVRGKKDMITFNLPKDSSYKFDEKKGIVFDDASAWRCTSRDTEATCTGTKADFGVYKYTINVVGLFAVPNDPWVVNN